MDEVLNISHETTGHNDNILSFLNARIQILHSSSKYPGKDQDIESFIILL